MRAVATLLLIVFSLPAHSENVSKKQKEEWRKINESMPINTYRFVGNYLVCQTDTPEELACHKIGSLKVGEKFTTNSKPWKEIKQENGNLIQVFSIISNEKYNAYWVIETNQGVIQSLQLTGNYPNENLEFSTIQLTDNQEKVKRVLGPRFAVSEVPQINGVLWDYNPFKISLEFVDGKVYSIRLSL